jgi:hypothetical protein
VFTALAEEWGMTVNQERPARLVPDPPAGGDAGVLRGSDRRAGVGAAPFGSVEIPGGGTKAKPTPPCVQLRPEDPSVENGACGGSIRCGACGQSSAGDLPDTDAETMATTASAPAVAAAGRLSTRMSAVAGD